MERLGGGKEQLIQVKGTRSFEGKQTPWCLCGFLGFLVVNHKSMTCCFLPILPVFKVLLDLPDASKVPYPVMVFTHLVVQWLLLPCQEPALAGGRCQWRAL